MNNLKMNPALIMILGSALMVGATASLQNALAAAFASVLTLLASALLVSVLKKFITDDMEIAADLVIIVFTASVSAMLTNCLFPNAYKAVSVYLSTLSTSLLAFVSCRLVRKEGFAAAVSTAVYFAVCLLCMGALRELIASGSLYGNSIAFLNDYTISIVGSVPGGLILFGLLLAITNKDGYHADLRDVLTEKGE